MQNTRADIKRNVTEYFRVLHCEEQRGGKFVFMPEKHKELFYVQNYENTIDTCVKLLTKYKNNSLFATLNSFHSNLSNVKERELRAEKNLWGLDCIMIDIDGCASLIGYEHDLIVAILKYTDKDSKIKIPMPTAYTISGGGGVHLYFAFYRLPSLMKDSVKTLKYLLAEKITYILKNDKDIPSAQTPYGQICTYKIDTKVFDNQRLDRVPGSIHPKTGKMVQFFPLDGGRYEWEELTSIINDTNRSYWGETTIPVIQQSILDIKECGSSKHFKNKKKISKRIANLDNNKMAITIGAGRRKHLLELAQSGKQFYGCREVACFLMSNFCMLEGLNDNERAFYVKKLNDLFYAPIKSCEINAILRQKTVYKFTNSTIANMLSLSDDEYKIMFRSKNTGKKKKEMFDRQVTISQLWLKGLKIKEIAQKLNISESKVKHTQQKIKMCGGYLLWSVECNIKQYKKLICEIVQKLKSKSVRSLFLVSKKSSKSLISNFSLDFFKTVTDMEFSVLQQCLSVGKPPDWGGFKSLYPLLPLVA